MKKIKMSRMLQMINDGVIECVTDLKIGYVEVYYMSKKVRMTVIVIE
jgi:hypothetical protein